MTPKTASVTRKLIWYWLPLTTYLVIIFSLSSSSDPTQGHPLPVSDKVIHFFEFGVLAVLFLRAFQSLKGTSFLAKNALCWAILFSLIYAGLDEWHQSFVPLRTPSGMDFLADALGICLFAFVYRRFSNGVS